MANTVEYIIQLNDKFSNGFGKIGNAVSQFNAKFNTIDKAINSTGNSVDSLGAKISKLTIARNATTSVTEIRKLNSEIRNLQNEAQKLENLPPLGFLKKISGAKDGMSNLAKSALGAFGAVQIFEKVSGIVKAGAEMEQTRVKFSVLLGDMQKGNKMIDDLNKFSNYTPLDNETVMKNAETLLAFGTTGDKILPTLQMLGDIAMGDKNKLAGLTLAFAQMKSTGRLMGQDLLQMINQGFNPLVEMSKMTGKSLATLKKEMEQGSISAAMVEKAFQHATSEGGMFHKMMEKQSDTLSGKWSTLMGKIQLKAAETGEGILAPFKKITAFAIDLIDNLKPLEDVFSSISEALRPIWTGIGNLAKALFTTNGETMTAKTLVSSLSEKLSILVSPLSEAARIFEKITNFLAENERIVKVLIQLYVGYIAVIKAVAIVKGTASIAAYIFSNSLQKLEWRIFQVQYALFSISTFLKGFSISAVFGSISAHAFANGIRAIGKAIYSIPVIGWIVAAIALIVAGVMLLWQKCEKFRQIVFGIWEAVKAVFYNIGVVIMAFWENIYKPYILFWWDLIKTVAQGIWSALKWCFDLIVTGLQYVADFFVSAWNWVTTTISNVWDWIVNLIKTIVGWISGLLGSVWTFITSRFSALGKWLSINLLKPIKEAFSNIWEFIKGVLDGIMNKLNGILKPIKELWNKIFPKDKFKDVGEAFENGVKKGSESWEKSQQKKKKETGSVSVAELASSMPSAGKTADNLSSSLDVGSKDIASGGSKPTNIYVNLHKEMIGQITINPLTMTQGVEEVKTLMMQAMSQLLNSANRIAYE